MFVATIKDKSAWDCFIDASPYGLLFHKWDYLSIIEKHSGYKLYPYGIFKGEELVCVFPLFYKSLGGMKMLFSPPPGLWIPYLGFVLSPVYDTLKQRKKESYFNDIIEAIDREISRLSPNYVSLSTVPGLHDVRPFLWDGYSAEVNYTYFIDLDKPLGEIWEGFDTNCRKAIKSCDKLGLELKHVNDADTYHRIYKNRYEDLGLNSQIVDVSYLKDIMAAYPENVRAHFLYKGNEVLSIGINIVYKENYMFWIGGISTTRDIPANEYIKWELIKKAKEEGFTRAELQGASIKHLCSFKSKFNPELESSYYLSRKDALGTMAEWAYRNIINKGGQAKV